MNLPPENGLSLCRRYWHCEIELIHCAVDCFWGVYWCFEGFECNLMTSQAIINAEKKTLSWRGKNVYRKIQGLALRLPSSGGCELENWKSQSCAGFNLIKWIYRPFTVTFQIKSLVLKCDFLSMYNFVSSIFVFHRHTQFGPKRFNDIFVCA